jgi:hypothetical protein
MNKPKHRKKATRQPKHDPPEKIAPSTAGQSIDHSQNAERDSRKTGECNSHKEDRGKMTFFKKYWQLVRDPQHSGAVIAIFTIVIACTGLVYTGTCILQWCVMRQTMINSERAFVFTEKPFLVGDGGPPGHPFPDHPAFLVVDFKNSGETPARKAKINVGSCASKKGIPSGFAFPPAPGPEPVVVIAPKGGAQDSFPIPNAVLADIETEHADLIVYGEITYDDVFDKSHRTEFCAQYRGGLLDKEGNVEKFTWADCDKHNCYDDDCPKKWGTVDCAGKPIPDKP